MDVADSHQRRNVWLVRLSGQRVAKKEHRFDVSLSDSTADDQVAPVGAVSDSCDVQAELLCQQLACVARCDKLLATEEVHMLANELQHRGFFLIVSDKCDHGVRHPGWLSAGRI